MRLFSLFVLVGLLLLATVSLNEASTIISVCASECPKTQRRCAEKCVTCAGEKCKKQCKKAASPQCAECGRQAAAECARKAERWTG